MSGMERHRCWSTPIARCAVVALLAASSAGLSGCTGQKLAKLSACNGKHLRPGNPNGSILPGAPIPPTTAPAGPGSPAAANSAPSNVAKTSFASPSTTYASC